MADFTEFDRLMAEVAAGSEEAVWQLAETYTPYIIRAVRRTLSPKLRQKVDSVDFAQTLWASLLLKPRDFTRVKTHEEFIRYLVSATRNKVCDKARQLNTQKYDIRREQGLDRPEERRGSRVSSDTPIIARDPTPSAIVSVRDQWNYVLSKTSVRDREIVRLRRDGHSFEQIGKMLGIYEQTARRAIQRLLNVFAS